MSERLLDIDTILEDFLAPGEKLLPPLPHKEGDLRDVYDYEYQHIRTADGSVANSVFLVMPVEGSASEPVTIVKDIVLGITVARGSGILLMQDTELGDEGMRTVTLAEGDRILLEEGISYLYINDGRQGPLVIRDDCIPDFKPEDEVAATHPRLHELIGELVC